MTAKEGVPPFMEDELAVPRVTRATEYMADTVVKSNSDHIEHKLQPLFKSVFKRLSKRSSEIQRKFAKFTVVKETRRWHDRQNLPNKMDENCTILHHKARQFYFRGRTTSELYQLK